MAYADSIRTTNPTFENVASLIDGQLITWTATESSPASPESFAATANITGCSATVSVATGESVLILAQASVSHSVINTAYILRVQEDGVTIGGQHAYARSFRADVNGTDSNITFQYVRNPSAGSHTYAARLEIGTATAYVRFSKITLVKFRNS